MDERLLQYNRSIVDSHHESTPKKEEAKSLVNENKMKVIENNGYTNNSSPTKSNYNIYNNNYYNSPQQNKNNYQTYTGYSQQYNYGQSNNKNNANINLEYNARIERIKKKAKAEASKNKPDPQSEYTKSMYGFGDFKVKGNKTRKRNKLVKQIGVMTAAVVGEAALGTLLLMTKETIKQIGEIVKDNII